MTGCDGGFLQPVCGHCPNCEALSRPSRESPVTAQVKAALASVEPAGAWDALADAIRDGGIRETVRTYLSMRRPGGSCWKRITKRNGSTFSGKCGKWGCWNGKGSGGYCTEGRAVELARQAASEWNGRTVLVVEGKDRIDGYLAKHPDVRLTSREGYTRGEYTRREYTTRNGTTVREAVIPGAEVPGHERTPGAFRIKGWNSEWLFVPDDRGTDDMTALGKALGRAILEQKVVHRAPKEEGQEQDEAPHAVAVPTWWTEADLVVAQDWPSERTSRQVRRATRRPTDEEWKRFVRRVRGTEPIPRQAAEPALTSAGRARAPTTY